MSETSNLKEYISKLIEIEKEEQKYKLLFSNFKKDLTLHNKVELDTVQKEMSDAITKAASDHELRMRQLQDQLDNLEKQCAETMEHNRDEEQRMRREKVCYYYYSK